MKVKIVSAKENPLLKRKEVNFTVEQGTREKTPPRAEVKKALAAELKTSEELVFVEKMQTLTGTNVAAGTANTYETMEQAKRIEPEYIVKRNIPPEKPKEKAEE